MSKITPLLLNDTLNLIQLVRETARIQGQEAQVKRLSPLVEGLRQVVTQAQQPPATASGTMAQDDFRTLLATVQSASQKAAPAALSSSPAERSQMVLMMADGGMSDLEIARHLGMTREEVQMVLSIHRRLYGTMEVIK